MAQQGGISWLTLNRSDNWLNLLSLSSVIENEECNTPTKDQAPYVFWQTGFSCFIVVFDKSTGNCLSIDLYGSNIESAISEYIFEEDQASIRKLPQ